MGKALLEFFDKALGLGGLEARVRLASLTRMGSAQAESAEDSPIYLQIFDSAFYLIKLEFTGKSPKSKTPSSDFDKNKLKFSKAYASLLSTQKTLILDLQQAIKTITELAAITVEVERASVWFYDSAKTMIQCHDLFSRKTNDHTAGIQLMAKDFFTYFNALETERTIAASNAHTDSRTTAFSEPYLKPLGINSMLDVPIWAHEKMVGVICHEHTGPFRKWLVEEEDFANNLASLVALAVEKNGISAP